MDNLICGKIIDGEAGKITIREKNGKKIELGDLLIVDSNKEKVVLQVYHQLYGSQLSGAAREQIAGNELEKTTNNLNFFDPELRSYILILAKAVLNLEDKITIPKRLPTFFGDVRNIIKEDFTFLIDNKKIKKPVFFGNLRSGSKEYYDIPISLNSQEIVPHHILICSTTGRGKSNMIKTMLWSIIGDSYIGVLVLDPHNEYYGIKEIGLKDHPNANTDNNILYYSINDKESETRTLVINLRRIKLEHFNGIVQFSEAQYQIARDYNMSFGERWIENILRESIPDGYTDRDMRRSRPSIAVIQRIFRTKLSIYHDEDNDRILCGNRIFSNDHGESTINDIIKNLENGKIVIVDTSQAGETAELLIGSMIVNELMSLRETAKSDGLLDDKYPIAIVIEEAPRVIGKEKLEKGADNIYSVIAKEGRKFKLGLIAITQLVSVIPREILANINTKIILGNELASERNAIIQSAAQDLSDDDRNIASLDKGEAIISSIFTKFAIPIKIPLFNAIAEVEINKLKKPKRKLVYPG